MMGAQVSEVRRVGITQRQVDLSERGEVRDALDARLPQLLWELGFVPVPLANGVVDAVAYLAALDLGGFVLSGGDGVGEPPARAHIERCALDLAERGGLPVLGICRGMQVLVTACGGALAPVDGHVATRHAVDGPLTGAREVNSFHEFGVVPEGLPQELQPVAHAPDGTVEAVRHRDYPWTGIMWHPERERPFRAQDRALMSEALMRVVSR